MFQMGFICSDSVGMLFPAQGPPGCLYCLWTLVRWTAPELMAFAKGGSENMHTCWSSFNKAPVADTGGCFFNSGE